jgi:hypothetical protein
MGNFRTRYLPLNELPQNIIGRIVSRQWKKRLALIPKEDIEWVKSYEQKTAYKIYVVTEKSKKNDKYLKGLSGFSLGKYICLTDIHNLATLRHEGGHCQQSQKLGWLYLPLIGIYSAVFCNLYGRIAHKKWCDYDRVYWYFKTRWTESWADRLGGVDRDAVLRGMARPANARYPHV